MSDHGRITALQPTRNENDQAIDRARGSRAAPLRRRPDHGPRSDGLLARTVSSVVPYCESDRGAGHSPWLLTLLHTDDGPTPPTGLSQVLPSWERWRIERLRPDDADDPETADKRELPATTALPCAEPAVLLRETG